MELEPIEIDHTLLGNRVEMFINAVVPDWILFYLHNNDCGCIERKEYLNDKHHKYRMKRIERLEKKLNRLKLLTSI